MTLELTGTGGNSRDGTNNTLHSEHPGGAQAARADGGVSFLSETMEIVVVRDISIRDDGGVLPGGGLQ